jgi:acyl-CoA thioester hydrolase
METKKHVHTTRIAMRWGDMDALGHVNNTIYFR